MCQPTLVEQLTDRLDPMPDPLGVVQPVHPEQHHARVAELGPDLHGPAAGVGGARQLVEPGGVHRDREGRAAHLAHAVGTAHQCLAPAGGDPQAAAGTQHVVGVGGALEAQQVGAEQAEQHLTTPRQLGEDLVRRERDVVEEPDPDVGAQLAQHLRHQLQLVVLDPHRGPGSRLVGGRRREAPVDRAVGLPPVPVEQRWRDHVVVQRPERPVGHALVVLGDLGMAQRDRCELEPLGVDLTRGLAGGAGPPDPHPPMTAEDRLERGDQSARTGLPPLCPVGQEDSVHGQPVGDDDQVVGGGHRSAHVLRVGDIRPTVGRLADTPQQRLRARGPCPAGNRSVTPHPVTSW